jgi:hypothetical protein
MYHQVLDKESSSPRTFPGVLSTKVRDQGSTHAICMGTLNFSRGPRLSRGFACLVIDQESTHAVCMGTLDFSRGPRLI